MPEETVVAESSAAEDVFQGQQPTFDEYSRYRADGSIPERFKPADEVNDAPEETADVPEGDEPESEPESEPDDVQEPPKGSGAEKRIKQLLARTKELELKLASKQDVTPAPSAAEVQPPAQQFTRTKPIAEATNPDGTQKYASYEDFVEDLAEWKGEQMFAQARKQQAEQEALKTLKGHLDEARERYEDADDVIFPAAQAINEARIPGVVKQVFSDSELFTDLCYVVGSDPAELKKFISLAGSDPRAAIAKVFEYERGIREELAQGKTDEPTAPVKKTGAPRPPSPVSGGSSRAFDVSDESQSPEEWARKRTADLKRRNG